MEKRLKDFCVGCGLCESIGKAKCDINEDGYLYPVNGDEKWLAAVCPAGGMQQEQMDFSSIWGRSEAVYYGWSLDENVRKTASSGGVITEIASWLLENKQVNGIVHTCADPKDATKTISCISTTRSSLIERSGSRYAISHPCEILPSLDKTKRYAFIGKPCDIDVLNNFVKLNPEWKEIIVFTISFFCAGIPSANAQNKLLVSLGCSKEELETLRYRGDGWPGYTTAVLKSGSTLMTDYDSSWGKILGRDIMKMCRFCLNGIGETADISCGDAWYLTDDKKPDFSEREGRNVVFARTERGDAVLRMMQSENRIFLEVNTEDDLKYIQIYQLNRRTTMIDKIVALKIMGRQAPNYQMQNIMRFTKYVSVKKHAIVFVGIVRRILLKII